MPGAPASGGQPWSSPAATGADATAAAARGDQPKIPRADGPNACIGAGATQRARCDVTPPSAEGSNLRRIGIERRIGDITVHGVTQGTWLLAAGPEIPTPGGMVGTNLVTGVDGHEAADPAVMAGIMAATGTPLGCSGAVAARDCGDEDATAA